MANAIFLHFCAASYLVLYSRSCGPEADSVLQDAFLLGDAYVSEEFDHLEGIVCYSSIVLVYQLKSHTNRLALSMLL